MPLLLDKGIGLERISRELLIILASALNAALDVEDAKWQTLDSQLATTLGIDYVPCLSDKLVNHNFYFGHRPSLVEAPIANYPNVSVYANQASPSNDQGDHSEGYLINVGVEAMCIEGPYQQIITGFNRTGEDLVNKKIQRMMESIHAVVLANKTFNGLIPSIDSPPRVQFSEPMLRRENTSYGADYYWQMVRVEYFIKKVSSLY